LSGSSCAADLASGQPADDDAVEVDPGFAVDFRLRIRPALESSSGDPPELAATRPVPGPFQPCLRNPFDAKPVLLASQVFVAPAPQFGQKNNRPCQIS
jgi:hypothetical protein